MKRQITTLGLLLLVVSFSYSAPKILFHGYIEGWNIESLNDKTYVPNMLEAVSIVVRKGNDVVKTTKSRSTGYYWLLLEPGENYTITFNVEGHFSKVFEVLLENVATSDFEESQKMITDIMMFQVRPVKDKDHLENTVSARCKYVPELKKLHWDAEYSALMKEELLDLSMEATK